MSAHAARRAGDPAAPEGSAAGGLVPGAEDRTDETGVVGGASASCAADGGDGIASGSVGWTTESQSVGGHELVCNLANHYADWMHQELDVTIG